MVLQLGIFEWIFVVWSLLIIAHIIFILTSKHWIKDATFIELIIFLVLSPVLLPITIYAIWQSGVDTRIAVKKEMEAFVAQCKENGICFYSKKDAELIVIHILRTLDSPMFDILEMMDKLETEGAVENCGDGDTKIYRYIEKN